MLRILECTCVGECQLRNLVKIMEKEARDEVPWSVVIHDGMSSFTDVVSQLNYAFDRSVHHAGGKSEECDGNIP